MEKCCSHDKIDGGESCQSLNKDIIHKKCGDEMSTDTKSMNEHKATILSTSEKYDKLEKILVDSTELIEADIKQSINNSTDAFNLVNINHCSYRSSKIHEVKVAKVETELQRQEMSDETTHTVPISESDSSTEEKTKQLHVPDHFDEDESKQTGNDNLKSTEMCNNLPNFDTEIRTSVPSDTKNVRAIEMGDNLLITLSDTNPDSKQESPKETGDVRTNAKKISVDGEKMESNIESRREVDESGTAVDSCSSSSEKESPEIFNSTKNSSQQQHARSLLQLNRVCTQCECIPDVSSSQEAAVTPTTDTWALNKLAELLKLKDRQLESLRSNCQTLQNHCDKLHSKNNKLRNQIYHRNHHQQQIVSNIDNISLDDISSVRKLLRIYQMDIWSLQINVRDLTESNRKLERANRELLCQNSSLKKRGQQLKHQLLEISSSAPQWKNENRLKSEQIVSLKQQLVECRNSKCVNTPVDLEPGATTPDQNTAASSTPPKTTTPVSASIASPAPSLSQVANYFPAVAAPAPSSSQVANYSPAVVIKQP